MSFGKDERRGIIALAILAIVILLLSFSIRMCGTDNSAKYINGGRLPENKECAGLDETIIYRDTAGNSGSKSKKKKKRVQDNTKKRKRKSSEKHNGLNSSSGEGKRGATGYRDLLNDTIPDN